MSRASVHPETEAEELLLARREEVEQARVATELHALLSDLLVGRRRPRIGHEVTQLAAVALVAERRLEAKRLAHETPDGTHLVDGQPALARQLLVRRVLPALAARVVRLTRSSLWRLSSRCTGTRIVLL